MNNQYSYSQSGAYYKYGTERTVATKNIVAAVKELKKRAGIEHFDPSNDQVYILLYSALAPSFPFEEEKIYDTYLYSLNVMAKVYKLNGGEKKEFYVYICLAEDSQIFLDIVEWPNKLWFRITTCEAEKAQNPKKKKKELGKKERFEYEVHGYNSVPGPRFITGINILEQGIIPLWWKNKATYFKWEQIYTDTIPAEHRRKLILFLEVINEIQTWNPSPESIRMLYWKTVKEMERTIGTPVQVAAIQKALALHDGYMLDRELWNEHLMVITQVTCKIIALNLALERFGKTPSYLNLKQLKADLKLYQKIRSIWEEKVFGKARELYKYMESDEFLNATSQYKNEKEIEELCNLYAKLTVGICDVKCDDGKTKFDQKMLHDLIKATIDDLKSIEKEKDWPDEIRKAKPNSNFCKIATKLGKTLSTNYIRLLENLQLAYWAAGEKYIIKTIPSLIQIKEPLDKMQNVLEKWPEMKKTHENINKYNPKALEWINRFLVSANTYFAIKELCEDPNFINTLKAEKGTLESIGQIEKLIKIFPNAAVKLENACNILKITGKSAQPAGLIISYLDMRNDEERTDLFGWVGDCFSLFGYGFGIPALVLGTAAPPILLFLAAIGAVMVIGGTVIKIVFSKGELEYYVETNFPEYYKTSPKE